MSRVTVSAKTMERILDERYLGVGGKAQRFFDSEVIRRCDKYVPMKTGNLKRSAWYGTEIGSGVVVYDAPYAHKQYYEGRNPGTSKTGKYRGRYWFERMKADNKESLLSLLKQLTGGR